MVLDFTAGFGLKVCQVFAGFLLRRGVLSPKSFFQVHSCGLNQAIAISGGVNHNYNDDIFYCILSNALSLIMYNFFEVVA